MDDESAASWTEYNAAHPVGSPVSGTVVSAAPFGVFVDIGATSNALLLVPYIAPLGAPKDFPNGYPRVGEKITAYIRVYGDDAKRQIGLTQATPGTVG